jgi:hypothetical protein
VDCQRYDLHDLRLVPFFLRRDHDERRYEHQQQRHGVDALRHSIQPVGDDNTVHCPAHSDHLGVGDDERNVHDE